MNLSIPAIAAAILLGSTALASAKASLSFEAPAARAAAATTQSFTGFYTGAPFATRCSPGAYGSAARSCGDILGGPVGGPNQS